MKSNALSAHGEVDVAICIDALHHLWSVPEALTRVLGLLRGRGVLIGNYLVCENVAPHVAAKKGWLRFARDYGIAEALRYLSFVPPVWELAGRRGYVRHSWLNTRQLHYALCTHFEVLTKVIPR
jgi:hypothetical protein